MSGQVRLEWISCYIAIPVISKQRYVLAVKIVLCFQIEHSNSFLSLGSKERRVNQIIDTILLSEVEVKSLDRSPEAPKQHVKLSHQNRAYRRWDLMPKLDHVTHYAQPRRSTQHA